MDGLEWLHFQECTANFAKVKDYSERICPGHATGKEEHPKHYIHMDEEYVVTFFIYSVSFLHHKKYAVCQVFCCLLSALHQVSK